MRSSKATFGAVLGAASALTAALVLSLWARPPELVRVGASYAAKIVCSNVFLAGRDPHEVLATDVQAPGHPLLRLMHIEVDRSRGSVRAGLFGFIGGGLAVLRPGAGCAVLPDGRAARGPAPPAPPSADATRVATSFSALPALGEVVEDDTLAGPGVRAIVVLQRGRILAERYARGFDRDTPQLGWSMTKTVTAGLAGLLVKDGRLRLEQSAGLKGGGRERVTIGDLMSMTSGLRFDEGYGAVSDVTRMLYLEPDMAAFAGRQPLIYPVGENWSYSSGSAVILARALQEAVQGDVAAYVRSRLFDPLGMHSAVIETDERGTLVGSSYMYATPLDWARYGQLLAQDGMWEDHEILPRGYVAMMASAVAASGGEYGHGMVWLRMSPRGGAADGLPGDAFWLSGHDGQYVAVIPSRQLVIVRMGLTPEREHFRPQPLVRAVLDATR